METIGDAAFAECTSLTSVTIPESVTTIGGGVFHTASSLSEVICKPIVPPVSGGVNMFKNNSSGRIIYVPEESVDAYKTASYWSDYAADIYSMNERIDPTPAISFEFAVDVTESSFSATVTPSADAYYIGEAFEKSDYDAKIAQYGTIDAYMKEYITTEFSWMSLVEAMELLAENNLFVHKGTWNAGYSQLPADTEFVIVAYLVDMTTCDALSEIETHEFKTLPASQPDPEQLFEFVVDVTESAFSATVTPTSDAYYIGEAFYKSDYEALVAQYGTIDAYMKEYIVENFSWMSLAESMALLAENDLLVHQGTWNVGYNNLPAGTAFVLVAYQVDMTTCNALSNVEIYEFSTSASTPMLIRRMNRVSQPKSTSSAMLSANQLKILIGRF